MGHLGIFVSADVALREHRAILHHAEAIIQLPPGLYEVQLAVGSKPMVGWLARWQPMRVSRQVWATSLPRGGAELPFAASAWVEQSIVAWRTLCDESAEITFRQLYGSDDQVAVMAQLDPSQVAPPAGA